MSNTAELATKNESALSQQTDDPTRRRITLTPPVDIFEDSQNVTLLADLPGVAKDGLNIRVSEGTLYIEAEATVSTPTGLRLQHAEIRQPHFARAFSLAADLDTSKIDASLSDGVLKLTIPRREEARPRRIEVRAS